MDAPGKGLLKVVSVLFIIAGIFAVITSIFGAAGSALLTSLGVQSGGIMIGAMLISTISGVLEIVFGGLGVKRCADPAQGQFFITAGIVLCAIQLLNMIVHSIGIGFLQVFGLLGFVLPVLYIVGGIKNKKAQESHDFMTMSKS